MSDGLRPSASCSGQCWDFSINPARDDRRGIDGAYASCVCLSNDGSYWRWTVTGPIRAVQQEAEFDLARLRIGAANLVVGIETGVGVEECKDMLEKTVMEFADIQECWPESHVYTTGAIGAVEALLARLGKE